MDHASLAPYLGILEEHIIWALSQEESFGKSITHGLMELSVGRCEAQLPTYCRLVRTAARTGATFGRILATHLVPVLTRAPGLLDLFLSTTANMQAKGTYTLSAPLEVLTRLLTEEDPDSAHAYLQLLTTTFAKPMSYNQSLRLVYLLPKSVTALVPKRRLPQIGQLQRVIQADPDLAESFLEGMNQGVQLLSPAALTEFVDTGLHKFSIAYDLGHQYLSLTAIEARTMCEAMQVVVPLSHVRGRLVRYASARMGSPVVLASLDTAPFPVSSGTLSTTDGQVLYLANEIEHFNHREQNRDLYADLVRLEVCFMEYGTFDFDTQRAADIYPELAVKEPQLKNLLNGIEAGDPLHWLNGFSNPGLAEDLFNLFEQARIMGIARKRYPGLWRRVMPLIQGEASRIWSESAKFHPLMDLYADLVLHMAPRGPSPQIPAANQKVSRMVKQTLCDRASVETAALLVYRTYDVLLGHLPDKRPEGYACLATPFGWRLNWRMVRESRKVYDRISTAIQRELALHGVKLYSADLQNMLSVRHGQLSMDALQTLIVNRACPSTGETTGLDIDQLDLKTILEIAGCTSKEDPSPDGTGCRYPEWDCHARDYLHNHTRVREMKLPHHSDQGFYQHTLARYGGLLTHTRRAFELLKPKGLTLLRQWPEGDAFDYRALLDFAVDRRAGLIPSDRLFIKRLKKERDVAVLVLVDMSRSTANRVSSNQHTVLDVAKEAMVIFCEALETVGDTYAIAGFSGTGRHSVDYFNIKSFDASLDPKVKARISAMKAQRSTRMGAAIRHAMAQLNHLSAAVRLLIIVSDGFPNDLGYKSEYAIADTRRAIQEARAQGHHVKAITVNIGSDPRLDELYGRYHYQIIEEVGELPDKLIRMYGTLTKV
jgi:hypothetical protein